MAQVTAVETSSRKEKRVHAWALLTSGISQSLMDLYLERMAYKVTLPTFIYSANQSQPSPGADVQNE
jgi:hypothetical protein